MPKSAADSGYIDHVVDLSDIPKKIIELIDKN
jgi:chemotaxis response regulator CheB